MGCTDMDAAEDAWTLNMCAQIAHCNDGMWQIYRKHFVDRHRKRIHNETNVLLFDEVVRVRSSRKLKKIPLAEREVDSKVATMFKNLIKCYEPKKTQE